MKRADFNKRMFYSGLTILPAVYPLVFIKSLLGNISVSTIMSLIVVALFLLFITNKYNKIYTVQGYIQRFIISVILLTVTGVTVILAPEKNNIMAGALMFLYMPSIFITFYLLLKSQPAKQAYKIYSEIYDKKT